MPANPRRSSRAAALTPLTALALLAGVAGASRVRAGAEPPPAPPGSDRHARVALDTDGGTRPLTFLSRALGESELEALRVAAPNVRIIAGLDDAAALELAPEVHGIDGRYCTSAFLQAATQLRWVQSSSAGVERYLAVPELPRAERVVLTNMQGVHGPTIADHAMAMLLALTRDLPHFVDPARRGIWDRGGSGRPQVALQDRTMLVVGLGGIGSEVARRGRGFGMRVLATRRSAVPPPPFVDEQGGPGDLDRFLAEADVVVLCVPLTAETEGLIGADALARMPAGSYLINIARGRVVDTAALVDALDRGHLAGAGLDVTDPEPLPSDHPLWQRPNVVITPHVAGRSELTGDRWLALYVENVRRFGAGAPLLNVVDKNAGY